MYIDSLHIYGFKCFGKAIVALRHPQEDATPSLPNVNLILGDNGGGKSSVLRAAAIGILAPALLESGFVPYRLVRRPDGNEAFLKVIGRTQPSDRTDRGLADELTLIARIERRPRGSLDRLHTESTPESPIEELIFDDHSPAFFVAGYGATRRVETGDFSESFQRRSRGLRYRRVAGLFEDHVPLRPMQAWLPKVDETRHEQVVELMRAVLPSAIRFDGTVDEDDGDYLFTLHDVATPFPALSDGYKAFIGWVSDLLGHLVDVCPPDHHLRDLGGVVLIDEIDLHLHPDWQRRVVESVARALPNLQFVMTTHSPLIASSVEKENIFLTMPDDDGVPSLGQLQEAVYGRSVEQLLLSSYFGLESTKPQSFTEGAGELFEQAARGDADATLAFLEQMAQPPSEVKEMTEHFARAKQAARKTGKTKS